MSEQEKKRGSKGGGSGVVVMDQAPPYRPPAPEESGPGARGQRARAPAVPSITGKFKKESSSTSSPRKGKKGSETPLSQHKIGKNTSEKPESPKETIAMTSLEPGSTKHSTSHSTKPVAPIPPDVSSTMAVPSPPLPAKPDEQSSADVNIESDDVAELRTGMELKHSEWSDEEEAGGLPRSDSRASRVSRAVRQLFCCGVPYEAPSEDNISARGFAL